MNDMRATFRERTQRFRRRMRGENKAVSPVVATLILILIAVAAAAALYLWLVAWQGNLTAGIGSPSAQYTVTIGGSTSVYPFSSVGVSWFEQNNSNVVISDNQGGTGAGMLAVCEGHVDVGAASSPQTVAGLQTNDGCPASAAVTITTIAYDAVDIIISQKAGNPGLTSINQTVLLGIYLAQSSTVPTGITYAGLGLVLPAGWPAIGSGTLTWTQVPTTAGCNYVSTCTYSADANTVHIYERSDTSGTEQTFTSRLLGFTSATAIANSVSTLGFGGCGSDGQLASCGSSAGITGTGENGNPAVIAAVAGDANGIGFASDGLARAAGSGVSYLAFAGPGQASAIVPSLGSSGSIAHGITGGSNPYVGWRPFEFVTLNPPTGEVERFFQFILDPANNLNIAQVSAEISIYSV